MNSAYAYIGFSMLLWSLFPLLLNAGVEAVDPLYFVLLIQLFAGGSSAVIALAVVGNRREFFKALRSFTRRVPDDFILLAAACGAASLCYNLCFAYAMIYAPEMSATVILEAWPIHAVYMSYFLIKKDWQAVTREDILIGLVSLIGFIVIVAGTIDDPLSLGTFGLTEAFGCLLALIGALTIALSTVLRARLGQEFEPFMACEPHPERRLIASVSVGEVIARIATLPFFALLFLVEDVDTTIATGDLILAGVIGVFIYNLGTVAYSIATLKSNSPMIHMSWFLMCILSVLWLQLAGEDTINPAVIAGMICILSANGYLVLRDARKSRKSGLKQAGKA